MKEGFEAFKGSFDLASFAVGGYPGLFLFAGIGAAATSLLNDFNFSHKTAKTCWALLQRYCLPMMNCLPKPLKKPTWMKWIEQ